MGDADLVTPGPAPATVHLAGFAQHYGRRQAVAPLDLAVRAGEIFGLVGPDGAGKSSILKAVAGVQVVESGAVDVFNMRLDSESAAEAIKQRIGFMPQGLGLNLYRDLTVEENLQFFARLRRVDDAAYARRRARLLGMTRLDRFSERPMKHLSGGMKQKLGLACSLVHEPELLILDEPTTGIDPVSRRDFWSLLAQLMGERRMTVLVATTYMDEASRFHRLALVHGGRLLAQGTPQHIQTRVPGAVVLLRVAEQTRAYHRLRAGFPQVEVKGGWLRLCLPGEEPRQAEAQVRAALGDMDAVELRLESLQLEDVFLELMRVPGVQAGPAPVADPMTEPVSPSPPATGIAIEAQALTRHFGAFRAVEPTQLRIAHGEVYGLIGANGAGKTTLMRMLTGLLPPTAGSCRVAGVDMRHAGRAVRQRIGYVSQLFSLYGELTVQDNLDLYAGVYGLGRGAAAERVQWAMAMGGLAPYRRDRTDRLPVGLRQRLALGCALLHRPQVLFLDEPTSGVDPQGRRTFWDVLFHLSRTNGVAILVTTHYMSEVENCDRVGLMHAGRIIAEGTPQEIHADARRDFGRLLEISSADPSATLERLQHAGYPEAELHGNQVTVATRDTQGIMQQVRAVLGEGARAVYERDLSMEDVFVRRITALEAAPAGGGR